MCPATLDILCLEPWMGGSHAAFLEAWQQRSAHRVELLGLPARHWRWRMRSAPWELARKLDRAGRTRPDVLLVSDYVDLPALLGFLPASWASVPTIAYFHENQLTYPGPAQDERDGHLAWTNLATCLRADALAFNSAFHRAEFRTAGESFLASLPRPSPRADFAQALDRSHVIAPGIELDAIPLGAGGTGPLRVLFPHRREHDKDPLGFLHAVREVLARGGELELVLVGERGARMPEGVEGELDELAPQIAHSGFVDSRAEYLALLGTCDLVVSTALHEFYGIAVGEALAAGCAALLPNRLAYPELLPRGWHAAGLYEEGELVDRLLAHARDPAPLRVPADRAKQREALAQADCSATARQLDECAQELADRTHTLEQAP